MNRTWQVTIGIGVFGILAISGVMHAALAQNMTPVSVKFRQGYDSTTKQIGGASGGDQIGADSSNTTYTDGENGGTVAAAFSSGGNLWFNTDLHLRSGGRRLAVAFEEPTAPCGAPCPLPSPPGGGTTAALVDAFMSTGHVTLTAPPAVQGEFVFGLKEMPVGSSATTDLNITFPGWFAEYNPTNYGASTIVNVTHDDEFTWQITAANPQHAQLIKNSDNGKMSTPAGTFYMPTEITITCPSC